VTHSCNNDQPYTLVDVKAEILIYSFFKKIIKPYSLHREIEKASTLPVPVPCARCHRRPDRDTDDGELADGCPTGFAMATCLEIV
jgi:hypothetical protein